MKKLILLLSIISISTLSFAQASLTVSWKFAGIVDGYDHINRCVVKVDGQVVGTSTEKKETTPNKMTVKVPTGSHKIEVMNFAYYEGNWEEHTVANGYSQDCTVSDGFNFKKKHKMKILFDIDNGTTFTFN